MRKKLTVGQLKRIVWLDMQRHSACTISERIGVSQPCVSKWLKQMHEDGTYETYRKELTGKDPVSFSDETPAILRGKPGQASAAEVYAVKEQLREARSALDHNFETVQQMLEEREELRETIKRLTAWLRDNNEGAE